jgi:hypothetical protein
MDLQDLSPNQAVGLADDAAFRGYFYGQSTPDDPVLGEVAVVYVKEPGQSGLKQGSVRLMAAALLVKVRSVMR